jgi:hypothetical protein
MDGGSCARGVRSPAAPPVPVPRLRNGLGVMGLSAGAPRLPRRWWWCDRAGLPVAPPALPFTVLLLGIAAPVSLLGVLGMDTVRAFLT